MNLFVFAAGLLYLGGSIQYLYQSQWKMAVVFLAYAIASLILSIMKEG